MKYVKLKPIYGLKNDCSVGNSAMYKGVGRIEGKYATTYAMYDSDGINIDYERVTGACSKAKGKVQWSNSANAQATKCLGIFSLDDGTNLNNIYFDNGKVYYFDSAKDPVEITVATPVTFANDNVDLYSVINFGGYMVFTDRGEHTPYKWKHGDANLTKLILAGGATEYKFRYIIELANRIVGVHSDQTNGDLDIRYTDVLPTWATLDFPAANQLYKPESYSPITGVAKLGTDTGYLFSEDDIIKLDYYPDQTPCFNAVRIMKECGSVNHASIVSDGNYLYFYDKRKGFIQFDGSDIEVISNDIQTTIEGITKGYHDLIVGAYNAEKHEIAWTVPIGTSVAPNYLFYYDITKGQWRREDKSARYIAYWQVFSDVTWDDLVTLTGDVWPTTESWFYYTSESFELAFGNTDGHLYIVSSEGDAGSNLDGYRVEPIMPICDGITMLRILEIWISFSNRQDIELDFYWRGGDSVGEVTNGSWTSLGSINMEDPDSAVLYIDQTARYHQFKWGTDAKSEYFSVDNIKIGYETQGKY